MALKNKINKEKILKKDIKPNCLTYEGCVDNFECDGGGSLITPIMRIDDQFSYCYRPVN